MLELPKVDITKINNDVYQIIEACKKALLDKGQKLNMEKEYQAAHDSMVNKLSESHSLIRTFSILMEYCVLIKSK